MGALAAFALVLVLVMLADADARACMEWEGGLHQGYDDPARPISTTWAAFLNAASRDLADPGSFLIAFLLCGLPFLPVVIAAALAPDHQEPGLRMGLSMTAVLAVLALGDPSAQHDCDRKGSEVVGLVVLLGPIAGLFCTILGLMVNGRFFRR